MSLKFNTNGKWISSEDDKNMLNNWSGVFLRAPVEGGEHYYNSRISLNQIWYKPKIMPPSYSFPSLFFIWS